MAGDSRPAAPVPSTAMPTIPTMLAVVGLLCRSGAGVPYHRNMVDESNLPGAGSAIRLLLVDDQQMVLDGLTAMLRPYSDQVVVVASTTDARDACRLAGDTEPDIALVDVRMKALSGLELCAELQRIAPGTKVVLLTVYDDEQYLFEALRSGAAGYLTKQVVAEELLGHLKRVLDGEIVVDPSLAGRVALSAARLHRGEFWPGAHLGLSQRESEVLELMVHGHSNRVIATRLVLGEETIKTHARSIYRKLGVADRGQAVVFALREGVYV